MTSPTHHRHTLDIKYQNKYEEKNYNRTLTARNNEETKQLLLDLKDALDKKDQSKTKQILSFLADKGFDLLVAIAAGAVFQK